MFDAFRFERCHHSQAKCFTFECLRLNSLVINYDCLYVQFITSVYSPYMCASVSVFCYDAHSGRPGEKYEMLQPEDYTVIKEALNVSVSWIYSHINIKHIIDAEYICELQHFHSSWPTVNIKYKLCTSTAQQCYLWHVKWKPPGNSIGTSLTIFLSFKRRMLLSTQPNRFVFSAQTFNVTKGHRIK